MLLLVTMYSVQLFTEIVTRDTAIWTHWKVSLDFSISARCEEQRHGGAAIGNTIYAVKQTPHSCWKGRLHGSETCVSTDERDCKTDC